MCETPDLLDCVLIGVDGGATETKAHAVACDDSARPTSFELRAEAASRTYERVPGFAPLPVAEQLTPRDASRLELSAHEEEQGALWVQAAAETVAEVIQACGARRALVGMGMPGLKTPDGRGICIINNGPRIPDYLDRFERQLVKMGVELVAPVAALGSDADYCGIGELHVAQGLFRDVDNAYYVGCGTGIADALKLRGRLVRFDEACGWIQKSWQIPSALGPTFERLVSAKSMNEGYARLLSTDVTREARFPEVDAAAGAPLATACMDMVALVLAELIFERLDTIKNGRREAPHRGDAYRALTVAHEYRGTLLDRVVIGQRLGQIYADPRFRSVFGAKLDSCLTAYIVASDDVEIMRHYLLGNALKPGLICASRLRAAPALGAAVAAVQALGPAHT
jgi:predicted NBD/HSP70 family sugar kinase